MKRVLGVFRKDERCSFIWSKLASEQVRELMSPVFSFSLNPHWLKAPTTHIISCTDLILVDGNYQAVLEGA